MHKPLMEIIYSKLFKIHISIVFDISIQPQLIFQSLLFCYQGEWKLSAKAPVHLYQRLPKCWPQIQIYSQVYVLTK